MSMYTFKGHLYLLICLSAISITLAQYNTISQRFTQDKEIGLESLFEQTFDDQLQETSLGQDMKQFLSRSKQKIAYDQLRSDFVYLHVPFSASPYYDFLDAFLLGVKLETYFEYSSECIKGVVFTVDDYSYFQNNVTLQTRWEDPVMNFTYALAGNFSHSIVTCYKFGYSWWTETLERFESFNNNLGDYLWAFLFNQMGNALAFKSIFDEIERNQQNQYYIDIFYQYGRLLRRIFDIQPLEQGDFQAIEAMFDQQNNSYSTNTLIMGAYLAKNLPQVFSSSPTKALKRADYIRQAINIPLRHVGLGTFQSNEDYFQLSLGIFEGMIDVLPEDNLLGLCKNNLTNQFNSIDYIIEGINDEQHDDKILKYLETGRNIMGYGAHSLFSCYYSFFNVVDPNTYSKLFVEYEILLNIVFNLGFMYTSIYHAVNLPVELVDYWRRFGYYSGDVFMRFFYRRPRSRDWAN